MIIFESDKIKNIDNIKRIGVTLEPNQVTRFLWCNSNYPFFLFELDNRNIKGKGYQLEKENIEDILGIV